jgi:single-stranded-DNA-specific exonuclease
MRWQVLGASPASSPAKRLEQITALLLDHRGLTEPKIRHAFLHPKDPHTLTLNEVGIKPGHVKKAIARINQAKKAGEPVIVFGDYDADGITATAILWEALTAIGCKAYPFIPSRDRHGYGLSIKGIDEAISSLKPDVQSLKPLIITVDNGIVAHEAASYVKDQGMDLIITDHHQVDTTLPPSIALVHTTELAGAGVAWMLAKELAPQSASSTLDLVTIGTIADMVPLLGSNREIVAHGLPLLQNTSRPGLLALFAQAGIEPGTTIGTYHVNYIIAPRINAMGRLEHGLDSLRLLLTSNPERATTLAQRLNDTNITRQDLTQSFLKQAHSLVDSWQEHHLLVVDHADFHEGIIGLVAGKLVETYYRPAVVIAQGKTVSKASVRSIPGVDIITYLRKFKQFYINAGGHSMAAGFTIKNELIGDFKRTIQADALTAISKDTLIPSLLIDCELNLDDINRQLFESLELLKPYGIGNREPVFCSRHCRVVDCRPVGKTGDHLKVAFQTASGTVYHAIGFNLAKLIGTTTPTFIDVAYTIEENVWNGHRSLQLHLKDIISK